MSKVIKELKEIQADALVMYTKLHNYHWNVTGMQFFPVHQMTEKMYDEFAELYDDAAELVLQRGDKPFTTMADIMGASRINEEKLNEFNAECVFKNILTDFETFKSSFQALARSAADEGDSTAEAFADDHVAKLEKDIWMLKASLG